MRAQRSDDKYRVSSLITFDLIFERGSLRFGEAVWSMSSRELPFCLPSARITVTRYPALLFGGW